MPKQKQGYVRKPDTIENTRFDKQKLIVCTNPTKPEDIKRDNFFNTVIYDFDFQKEAYGKAIKFYHNTRYAAVQAHQKIVSMINEALSEDPSGKKLSLLLASEQLL